MECAALVFCFVGVSVFVFRLEDDLAALCERKGNEPWDDFRGALKVYVAGGNAA